ncbi:MAG TPA: Gfo/Idh/MocA family oxidoreductase [Solirubrobacterales bacterium]|nr:Gfo/Idh/MocA family oxidoreductase [Solirubrobacterales bacterium]
MSGRSPQAPLRVGIVGCGRIVERGYLPALREARGVALAALADPDLDRARRLAALGGAAVHESAAGMIAGGGVDAVVVATPVERHLEVATEAASAGLPSLVEKPPAADLGEALALAALEPAPSLAFNRRFVQGRELRPLVPAAGWLELELELRFRRVGWGAHVSRDDALLDAGTHLIDLAVFLAGSEPIAVRDAAVAPERASLELELGRGRARLRCATDRPYAERVEIRDRAGRLLGASRADRLRARARRLRGGEDPLVGSLQDQVERFAARLRGEQAEELAGPLAGVATMAVVEAARRSAALNGAEVTVAVPEGVA